MEILIFGIVMAWLVSRKLDKFNSLSAAALIILPVTLINFGLHLALNAKYTSVWLNLIEWRNWVPILVQLLIVWLLCWWAKHLKSNVAIFAVLVIGSFLTLIFVPSGVYLAISHLGL